MLGDKDQLAAVEAGAVFAELSAQPAFTAQGVKRIAGALGDRLRRGWFASLPAKSRRSIDADAGRFTKGSHLPDSDGDDLPDLFRAQKTTFSRASAAARSAAQPVTADLFDADVSRNNLRSRAGRSAAAKPGTLRGLRRVARAQLSVRARIADRPPVAARFCSGARERRARRAGVADATQAAAVLHEDAHADADPSAPSSASPRVSRLMRERWPQRSPRRRRTRCRYSTRSIAFRAFCAAMRSGARGVDQVNALMAAQVRAWPASRSRSARSGLPGDR